MLRPEKLKMLFPYVILMAAALLIFWQVTFFKNTFKWDMMTYYFPMRFYVSECIQSGNLPLWLPYQLCGLPLYGDPQSGAWYPVVWLISIFHGYDLRGAAIEFLFTIFIAGAGFFNLAKGLKISSPIALLTGVCYMSCGFFIGHGQHLTLLISAAYLPFAIHFYLRFLNTLGIKEALSTALVLFLMFTGGYPGHFIILFYLFLIFFLIKLTNYFIERNQNQLKRFSLRHVFLLTAFLFMSAIALLSYSQCMPSVSRGNPLSLIETFVHPFSPQSALSFIFPFATRQHTDFFKTDFSMSNGYFGIFPLIFLLGFFFIPKSRRQYLFLFLAMLFLLASMGEATPIRSWLYHYVPMMNYFRYPSIFRIFFILLFLILAGYSMDYWLGKINESRKKIIAAFGLGVIVLAGIMVYASIKNYSGIHVTDIFYKWKFFVEHSSIYDHIIIQSVLHLSLLSAFIVILFWAKEKRNLFLGIGVLAVVDMFAAAQLNMDFTVTSPTPGDNPRRITEKINKYPKGFPLPDSVTIGWHKNFGDSLTPLYENLNIFGKQVHHEGYGPFLLNIYHTLLDSEFSPGIFQNRYCYFADSVIPYSALEGNGIPGLGNVCLDEKEISDYIEYGSRDAERNFMAKQFGPNHVMIETQTEKKQLLVFMQNNFKGWRAKVNGEKARLLTGNYSLMVVPLEPGKNIVELIFQPQYIPLAAGLSLLSVILAVVFVFIGKKKGKIERT